MVGRIPGTGAFSHTGERAADQIVNHGDALGGHPQGGVGEQNVIVDQRGAMAHFHENVLAHHAAFQLSGEGRFLIVMEQVLGDAGALCLPVAPDSHGAVVEIDIRINHIDGGVHFDAGDLRAAQLHHVVDMVDVIVLDDGEHAAHPSDDSSLFTMVNIAAADDVAAHLLLQPSVVLAPADSVPLHLGGTFYVFSGKVMVIFRIQIFPQRNAGTFAVADFTVLDDPASGPVGADHAVLVGGGRRPGGGGFGDEKTADGYVTDTGFGRHETFPADVDLHLLPVGILSLEIGVDDRLAAFLFGIPFVNGSLRFPGTAVDVTTDTFLQGFRLVHHPVVEIDGSGVPAASGKVPVAVHIGGVGVIISENGVVNPADPYGALIGFPVFHRFRAGDHRPPAASCCGR